jgi:hypothetical protein
MEGKDRWEEEGIFPISRSLSLFCLSPHSHRLSLRPALDLTLPPGTPTNNNHKLNYNPKLNHNNPNPYY